MKQTFFKFDHRFYRQTFGTPMGSPIFPSLRFCHGGFGNTDIRKNRFRYSVMITSTIYLNIT